MADAREPWRPNQSILDNPEAFGYKVFSRQHDEEVAGLLYGPPPKDDAGLAQLARRLDELESEVHRS